MGAVRVSLDRGDRLFISTGGRGVSTIRRGGAEVDGVREDPRAEAEKGAAEAGLDAVDAGACGRRLGVAGDHGGAGFRAGQGFARARCKRGRIRPSDTAASGAWLR